MIQFQYINIGDAPPLPVRIRTGAETYLDMTGGYIYFTVKKLLSDLDVEALISKKIAGTGTTTYIQLEHDDTKDLPEGKAWFDVRYIDGNNRPVTTRRQQIDIIKTVTERVV